MKPYIQPYLFLGGRCEAALAYYREHLGAEVQMLMRYRESPEPPACPLPQGWEDKIMHAAFTVGGSTLMASDGMKESEELGRHCLSLFLADAGEAARVYNALADGGEVCLPLGRTFWSPCFGMVTDRFGLHWMVTLGDAATAPADA